MGLLWVKTHSLYNSQYALFVWESICHVCMRVNIPSLYVSQYVLFVCESICPLGMWVHMPFLYESQYTLFVWESIYSYVALCLWQSICHVCNCMIVKRLQFLWQLLSPVCVTVNIPLFVWQSICPDSHVALYVLSCHVALCPCFGDSQDVLFVDHSQCHLNHYIVT